MTDLSYLYSMNSAYLSSGLSTWYVIGGVLALLGTIVVSIVFIRSENRMRYTGWMKRISTHVNFERYIIPLILKFLYVLSVLFAIINGIITMISGSFWTGLLMTVLAPIVIRMVYELIMMMFSIHNGIMETNRLLRGGAQPVRNAAPQQYQRPMHPQQPEAAPEPTRPEQPRHYPGGYDPMHRG